LYLSWKLEKYKQLKRAAIFITLGLILFVACVIWIYQSAQVKKVTPWDLIGKDAALVFELPNAMLTKQKLGTLKSINSLAILDGNFNKIINSKLVQNGTAFLSIHATARDDFGFLFFTEVNPSVKELYLNELIQSLQTELTLKKRLYNGVEIHELLLKGKPSFSFAFIDDIFILSRSSFLLEGALRLRSAEDQDLFKIQNALLFKLPTLQSDEGNIYFNVSNLLESTHLFLQPRSGKTGIPIGGSSLADLKLIDNQVLLNGFVINSEVNLLTLFEGQQPQPFDMEELISNRVAAIAHFGVSDIKKWFVDQQKLIKSDGVTSTDSLEQELLRLSVKVDALRKSIGNQFANCYISDGESSVSIIKLSDDTGTISVFDELSFKLSEQKKDSLYVEDYAGYQIKLIDYRNFLHQLFYPLAPVAEQTFFVQVGQYLILSESVESVKLFIDDMDAENTWGKTVEWNRFLSTSLRESNVNLFFDGKLASLFLRNQFNAKWKNFFDSTQFVGIDKGSLQLSRLETNYYLNASLQFSERLENRGNSNLLTITNNFGSTITRRPTTVKSHVSKDIEVVIEDSLKNLYLLSKDLKVQWKEKIGDRILGDVDQVDFFSNGKLQYFFITEKGIHIIDRLGRYVDGFPRQVEHKNNMEYSAVVDYDRSRRYRYLMTENKGNLLLTDKNGNLLEGWNPLVLNGKMIAGARHYRILGKDYFIAVNQNGIVYLMNRRGEIAKGFPLNLEIRPGGELSVTVGNTLSSTYFTVVSKDGLKVQFGLDGQIRRKEVLLKKASSSQFSLVKSVGEDSFVFLRIDPSKIGILQSDGKTLFEVENSGSSNWQLTYLDNRLKERFYCLYDQQQNFSYYYDSKGRLLLRQPLESTQLPTLYYDEKLKSLSIYNVLDSSVSLVSIKK